MDNGPVVDNSVPRGSDPISLTYGFPYGPVPLESDMDPAVWADDSCGLRHYRR
ncbi:hypothetical protein GCM10010289_51230 [Streptomyces violascens]|uniref:Uncharacterized protein n=1 Tax=Streptomyces violascens TaxID=67381 RepID=A0ABQ3QQ65_9ACTN|nr:hypothetical protein GCM10010289_51230 [Streptomyces violascens]GHI39407.1 hypothetical protein Sviol_38150 [Streptomyces violascens]